MGEGCYLAHSILHKIANGHLHKFNLLENEMNRALGHFCAHIS